MTPHRYARVVMLGDHPVLVVPHDMSAADAVAEAARLYRRGLVSQAKFRVLTVFAYTPPPTPVAQLLQEVKVAPVRETDPSTSRQAREAAINFSSGQWARILLHMLKERETTVFGTPDDGRTASEIDMALNMTPSSVSKRLGELERAGYLEVVGTRKSRRSPRQQSIYRLTSAGVNKAREIANQDD